MAGLCNVDDEAEKRTRTQMREDVLKLKEWLLMQPHLPQGIDDDLLLAFVNGTNSLEIAKQKLDSYYSMRLMHPEYFDFSIGDPLSKEFKESASAAKIFVLPRLTPEGWAVGWGMLNSGHLDKYHYLHHQYRLNHILTLLMKKYPELKGFCLVIDLKGVESSLLPKLNITNYLTVQIPWFQNSLPIRFKKGIFLNTPSIMNSAVNFFLSVFKEKMKERVVVTSKGNEVLPEHLSLDMLPSDYGGKEKSSDELNDYWLDLLLKNRDFLKKKLDDRSDETKRLPDTKSSFGIKGTFRSLDFD